MHSKTMILMMKRTTKKMRKKRKMMNLMYDEGWMVGVYCHCWKNPCCHVLFFVCREYNKSKK